MEEVLTQILLLIDQDVAPQVLDEEASLPALTYKVVDSIPDVTMDGPTGKTVSRMQIDVWALSFADAKAFVRQVQQRLDGHEGIDGQGDKHKFYFEDVEQLYEQDPKIFHHAIDFKVNSYSY